MRAGLISLQARVGITSIDVTHDQTEAMTLGDRVVVMNKGVVRQVDTPDRLYRIPANTFVAGFIGSPAMNFFDGRLESGKRRLGPHMFELPENVTRGLQAVPSDVIVGVCPEDLLLSGDSVRSPLKSRSANNSAQRCRCTCGQQTFPSQMSAFKSTRLRSTHRPARRSDLGARRAGLLRRRTRHHHPWTEPRDDLALRSAIGCLLAERRARACGDDARTLTPWSAGRQTDSIETCGSGSRSPCTASSTGSFLAPLSWRSSFHRP